MKTLSIALFALSFLTFFSAKAQDRYLAPNEYPAKISSFVKKNFPKSEISSVKLEKEVLKTEYEVKLNDGVELEFNQKFEIIKIDSKTGIPDALIPQKIREYVSKNFPNRKIEEWKKKRITQEIELDNSIDLVFDSKGKFLRIDD